MTIIPCMCWKIGRGEENGGRCKSGPSWVLPPFLKIITILTDPNVYILSENVWLIIKFWMGILNILTVFIGDLPKFLVLYMHLKISRTTNTVLDKYYSSMILMIYLRNSGYIYKLTYKWCYKEKYMNENIYTLAEKNRT